MGNGEHNDDKLRGKSGNTLSYRAHRRANHGWPVAGLFESEKVLSVRSSLRSHVSHWARSQIDGAIALYEADDRSPYCLHRRARRYALAIRPSHIDSAQAVNCNAMRI